MKLYTDLGQSEKLSEFLPIERADGYYPLPCDNNDKPLWGQCGFGSTPCWSLAALLDVLPLETETHKQTDGYKVYYYVVYDTERRGGELYLSTERHENLVDACYEMIVKLHESNKLVL